MINLQATRQPTEEDVTRLRLALAGFRASMSRHESAHKSKDLQSAYLSIFEATMWISALDEQLREFYDGSYAVARNQDEYGKIVKAVRWARNRHAHQLPVTLDEDKTPFFGGGNGIITLSAGIRWRAISDLPPPNPNHLAPSGESAYREQLEGQNAYKTLARCDRWFSLLESSDSCML